MVGPNGLEPSTSSVSRKRSNRAELRAYSSNHITIQGAFHRPRPLLMEGRQLQISASDGDNRFMPETGERSRAMPQTTSTQGPFSPGSMVVVTLGNPRDKFWGMILSLAPEGLSLSGIELASFDDLVVMVKDKESFNPAVVFFPMHRIERIELDLPDGTLPSLSQRFTAKTGLDPAVTLSSSVAGGASARLASTVAEKTGAGNDTE